MKEPLSKSITITTLVSTLLLSNVANANPFNNGLKLFKNKVNKSTFKFPSKKPHFNYKFQHPFFPSFRNFSTDHPTSEKPENSTYKFNLFGYLQPQPLYSKVKNSPSNDISFKNTDQDQKDRSLRLAATKGDTKKVTLLLEAGADVNRQSDITNTTPLMEAAENDHTEIVKLLLAAGAHVNLQGKLKMTPLIWAAENGHIEIVKLLLAAGAHVNHQGMFKMTALLEAIERGHVQIAKLLINHGADLNFKGGIFRETPLLSAHRYDQREIVDALLEKGADPQELSPIENSPSRTHEEDEADDSNQSLREAQDESLSESLESKQNLQKDSDQFESTKAYQQVVDKIRKSLQKPECKNVVILGNAGVGKTQLVMKFLADIGNGKFPELPKNTLVKSVNIGTFLDSKSQFVGQVQDKLNKFLSMMSSRKNSIIFMDEIHSFRGAGTTKSDSNDLFQHMKSYLAKGDVTLIGTSTHSEFYEAFGGDQALLRRFSIINLEEPDEEELPSYMNAWSKRYNKPILKEDVLKHIIHLSNEFSASGSQPSKATGLLSEVYATKQLEGDTIGDITIQDINQAASRLYNIDPTFFDTHKIEEKLQRFPDFLNQTLIGQKLAQDTLFELVEQRFTQSHDKTKPALRILVAGLPGVGKTELGRALAKGMNLPFVRIEMNKYAEGNVEGFRREMAEAIRKNAYSVLILDELEKADSIVQQALLALLDSGEMTISENINSTQTGGKTSNTLNFKNSHIFATTNAAQQLLHSNTKPVTKNELTQELIRGGIPAPVLDRFQAAVPIFPPSETEFRDIVQLGLRRLIQEQELESKKSIQIENEKEFLDNITSEYLIAQSKGEILNGREAQRILQHTVRSSIAKAKRKAIASKESNLSIYLPIQARE